MNWYKIAQKIIESPKGENKSRDQVTYLDIGHSFGEEKEPNYLWAIIDGSLQVVQENPYNPGHDAEFSHIDPYRQYSGRYDTDKGFLSILKPHNDMAKFRDIPGVILNMLKNRFPNVKEIHIF